MASETSAPPLGLSISFDCSDRGYRETSDTAIQIRHGHRDYTAILKDLPDMDLDQLVKVVRTFDKCIRSQQEDANQLRAKLGELQADTREYLEVSARKRIVGTQIHLDSYFRSFLDDCWSTCQRSDKGTTVIHQPTDLERDELSSIGESIVESIEKLQGTALGQIGQKRKTGEKAGSEQEFKAVKEHLDAMQEHMGHWKTYILGQ